MKRYWVAAGTLLLGTSTIAWAQTDAKVDATTDKTVVTADKTTTTTDKSAWIDKSYYGPTLATWESKPASSASFDDAKVQTAAWSGTSAKSSLVDAKTDMASWSDGKFQTASSTDAKLQTAAWNDAKTQTASWNEAKVQTASWDDSKSDTSGWNDTKVETAAWDDSDVRTASLETWSDSKSDTKLQTASYDKVAQTETGMGGPLDETTDGSTSLDLAPRPATQNYPPCSPGPGDDRCIQLYEPGVRTQLAAWNQPTGGLADDSTATAMGGPYEPVDDAHVELASVEHDDVATMAAADTDPAMSDSEIIDHGEYQGVGGPVEAQSGYPPCSAGPSDDRCIQLYESGVTGAGN